MLPAEIGAQRKIQARVGRLQPLVGGEMVERILTKGEPVTRSPRCQRHFDLLRRRRGRTAFIANPAYERRWHKDWMASNSGPAGILRITKKMHNALQGGEINLSDLKQDIYEEVVFENAMRNHIDHDLIIVHDPQLLPLICYFRKKAPWIWRCHVDLSNPNRELWAYLASFVERYDAAVRRCRSMRKT